MKVVQTVTSRHCLDGPVLRGGDAGRPTNRPNGRHAALKGPYEEGQLVLAHLLGGLVELGDRLRAGQRVVQCSLNRPGLCGGLLVKTVVQGAAVPARGQPVGDQADAAAEGDHDQRGQPAAETAAARRAWRKWSGREDHRGRRRTLWTGPGGILRHSLRPVTYLVQCLGPRGVAAARLARPWSWLRPDPPAVGWSGHPGLTESVLEAPTRL